MVVTVVTLATRGMAALVGTIMVASRMSRAASRNGLVPAPANPERKTNPARRAIPMLNTKVVTWSLGLFGAVTFVVCIVYGLIVPERLHMTGFLESVLPGFRWLTPAGVLIGLVESFLYGVYAGLVYTPIYNALARRWPASGAAR
jgi:hypothetical protein